MLRADEQLDHQRGRMKRPILLSMGTRPEVIKMAPLYRALKAQEVPVAVLHTGQHDSMAWPLYEFFGMAPDHVLALERGGQALAHLSAALLRQAHEVLASVQPRAVMVHGDTSSAAMVALGAFYEKVPVGHVEAGLRSHDSYDPFPEEMNRSLIARIAHWHFAPTPCAAGNLRREGVPEGMIDVVGNTVVDATRWASDSLRRMRDQGQSVLPDDLRGLSAHLAHGRLALVTAHRRENWGIGIANIARAMAKLLVDHTNLVVVWPVHVNPAVQSTVREALTGLPATARQRLYLCDPVSYPALVYLLRQAWLVLTDSGGIQEEAVSERVPVLVLRETTERPELLDVGAGLLVGTAIERIVANFENLWRHPAVHEGMRTAVNPFGDGRAGERIGERLAHSFLQPVAAAMA